jgi:hypothetical protein
MPANAAAVARRTTPPLSRDDAERVLLREALDEVLGKVKQVTLARECDVSKAAVCQWDRVPDKHIRTAARLSGLPLKKVRPDVHDPKWQDLLEAKMAGQGEMRT